MLEIAAFGLIYLAFWAAHEISERLEWSSIEKTFVMWMLGVAFLWILAEIVYALLFPWRDLL